jgi:hypothetical protein
MLSATLQIIFSDRRMAMLKSTMPNMPNIPGMGAMTDTLEFVKSLWGGMGIPGTNMPGMNVPGMVMPTLSVDELRKKISDLKAVESWLELNMNMLRGMIQALEVQAATISTLQSMGDALNATVNASTGNVNPPARPMSSAAEPPPPKATHQASLAPEPTTRDEADAASLTAPLVNAAAWWNMLQDQFRHAVDNAMSAEMPAANGADRRPAAKPKARPQKEAAPVSMPARKRRSK